VPTTSKSPREKVAWQRFRVFTYNKLTRACCYFGMLLAAVGLGLYLYLRSGVRHIPMVSSTFTHIYANYSVVLNSYKRHELLRQTTNHYDQCKNIDKIFIHWNEDKPPPQDLTNMPRVRFVRHPSSSINNRFEPIQELNTDCVFSVDDDVEISCEDLDFAFSTWQMIPSTMVGFVPRIHWIQDDGYSYKRWWDVWSSGYYSMVLTKCAFFHRKYLELYTHEMDSRIRKHVDNWRNCEDLAMSFLVAKESKLPPVWVQGKVKELGKTGLSSSSFHMQRRSNCLNKFVDLFGSDPLLPTPLKIHHGKRSWFW